VDSRVVLHPPVSLGAKQIIDDINIAVTYSTDHRRNTEQYVTTSPTSKPVQSFIGDKRETMPLASYRDLWVSLMFVTVSSFAVRLPAVTSVPRGSGALFASEDGEFVRVPRRRQRGRFIDEEEEREYRQEQELLDDEYEESQYDDEEEDWDDDDEWDDDEEDEEEYGIFSNVIIDNPLLDSIDPDGAAERFPELARDPKFWFDMALFFILLDFLSEIGPRNHFPENMPISF